MAKKTSGEFAVYRRILRIDELISNGAEPTIDDLMNDHEIEGSRATIYRALESMKLELNAPIEKNPITKGFYYSDKTFRLPTIFTTEQEMFAVSMLQNMTNNLKGTPIYESAKKVLETIQNSAVKNPNDLKWDEEIISKEDTKFDWVQNRYIFLDDSKTNIEEKTWNTIEDSFKKNCIIEFDYNGAWKTETSHRVVKPIQSVFSNCTWYLWSFDIGKNDYRMFQISRIKNAILKSEKFVLKAQDDFYKHSNGIFGAFSGEQKELKEFKAKFYDEAVEFIKDKNWGFEQKIDEQPDGTIILSVKGNQYYPFLKMILSFGCNAIPLAPKELVDDWKWHVYEMQKSLSLLK